MLAVIARCIEPGEIVAQAKERDSAVERDDSFQVYLATSGSRYVQYAINPSGVLLDAFGNNGTVRLSLPHREWNSPVQGTAWRDQSAWYARLDLPLTAAEEILGETEPPHQWKILLRRNRPGRKGEPRKECAARNRKQHDILSCSLPPYGVGGKPIRPRSPTRL